MDKILSTVFKNISLEDDMSIEIRESQNSNMSIEIRESLSSDTSMDISLSQFSEMSIDNNSSNILEVVMNDEENEETKELEEGEIEEIEEPEKIPSYSNPIIENFRKKYKPEELTDDGVPTIETQLKEIKVIDEELNKRLFENRDLHYKRELTQRVKCLALHKMGKGMLYDTYNLTNYDKEELQKIMWSYNDIPHDEIIREFNKVASREILDNRGIDISKLPIYTI